MALTSRSITGTNLNRNRRLEIDSSYFDLMPPVSDFHQKLIDKANSIKRNNEFASLPECRSGKTVTISLSPGTPGERVRVRGQRTSVDAVFAFFEDIFSKNQRCQ